jgi:exodeoxyribonuclease V gamma subunit
VLDLVGGRFKANDLVALVEHEAIQRAFKLGESDLAQIRAWVDSAGIHWGLDSRQRAAQRQPPLRAGTWRHGVDSVLLGYALNGENGRMFDGHCPETDVEGDRARSLGAFAKIVAIIEQLEHDSRLNRSLAEWARLLERSAKELAGEVEEFKPEYFELLRVFRLLAELPAAHLQSRDESVAFVAVRASINDLVREFVPSGGFMSGGVTFSSLRPMRSVPARVICLLGINEQDFPRSLRRSRFDLLAGDPQPGDRSPRSEDRQIFLESYLSARDVFYVSYTGMDAKSGEALPCPVIVEEFLEFIGEISTIEVTQQPLLGVSRRYLRDEQLRTYSEGNWAAAKRLSDPAAPQTAFLNEPLPEPAPGDKIFTVEQLVSFFLDPVRYFLEHRLGMAISTQREDDFPDSEPFTFDRLQTYNVRKQRINELLTGEDTQMWDVLESRAALSFGPVGRAEHSDIDAVAAAFVGSIASDSISPAIARVTADLGGGYAVHGTLGEHADFLKVVVPARQSARKLLDVWLRHLLWQRAEHPAPERSTRACFMDQHGAGEMLVLNAPPDVDALIGDLGRILAIGMTRPIRFFPLASRTYAANRIKSGDDDDAHTKAYHQARGVWYNRNAASTESEEAHWTLAFGEDPLGGEEFVDLALRVWGPVYRLAGDQIT